MRVEPERPATDHDADLADTAHAIRNWRRRGRLPSSPAEDEVECHIINRMRRRIESAAREFIAFVRQGVPGIGTVGDPSWVNVTKEFWLTSIDVLVRRALHRLEPLRISIEDIEVTQRLVEMSKGILVPMTEAMHQVRRRVKVYLGGMVVLEALLTGATLRAVGVEGGLLTTWPIAIAAGATIVVLGAACGGVLWPRLKRPGISAWGRWVIVIGTAIPVIVALYVAIAMGIVRSTGSFEIEAIIKIVISPSPKDIGSIALTILNVMFFSSAFWLSYRAKRDVDDSYETIVAVRNTLEENLEEDVEKTENLLVAMPMAAAIAFGAQRRERLDELAAVQQTASNIDGAWRAVTQLSDEEIDAAEGKSSRHRGAVVRIWRREWGCEISAFYYEQPDLRSIVAPVLDAAEAKVKEIRDRLSETTRAAAKVDAAITAALIEIQTAVREGIAKLDAAAYGPSPASPSSSPTPRPPNPSTSMQPARSSLKLVPPITNGDNDAPPPAE